MNDQITQVYDEHVIRHNAAYTAFTQTYELETPRPTLESVSRDFVSLLIVIGLTIVSIAAIIVSGSRTIEEFGGTGIGTVAFVMIEGGIMAYSFFIARRNANKQRLQNTVKWAIAGLILTVIVGLGANADSVLRSHGIYIPEQVKIAINLLVALSAPALAFISSDVLAIELMATEIRRREALLIHEKKSQKWLKEMNKLWRSHQREYGAKIKIQKPEPILIERETSLNLIKNNQNSPRNKPSPRLQKALDYLREHPEYLETPSRELEVLINGVSYGTINKAQVIIRSENNA